VNPTPSSFPAIGPGTQPEDEDGVALQFMQLPSEMSTFARPIIPEPEEVEGLDQAMIVLEKVLANLQAFRRGDAASTVDLSHLDKANLSFIDQMMGQGEVSIIAGPEIQVQEAVMAGIWRVRQTGADGRLCRDVIETGHFPASVATIAFKDATDAVQWDEDVLPDGLQSAPALLSEINDQIGKGARTSEAHAINLTLLPHSEEDLGFISEKLGGGSIIILSRGYGNCRVTSTATRHVWWVQHFNSQDALILNSLEITPVPESVLAAIEDIEDSAERLDEILEIYR
jgi:hydrogenase-1 operon protein HyaF